AQVHQERNADQGDDNTFLEQLLFQGFDSSLDERATVIDDFVANIVRQAFYCLLELFLHIDNDLTCVRSVAHDDNSADRFTLAIEFSNAASHIRSEFDIGHLAQQDRYSFFTNAHSDVPKILQPFDIAADAQHELFFREFDRASANLPIAA